jgi:tellurite resistance protein TehA-like permease
VFAVIELMRLRRTGGVPFHIGWWSFVFPTAAMALSIGAVGDATGLLAVQVLGAIAALALACVWAMLATRTLMAVHEQGRAARS